MCIFQHIIQTTMKVHESAENYLEAIYILNKTTGSVRSIDVATHLEFSKPSVSIAMKNLKSLGHIDIDKNGFITLTDSGYELAINVYERHTLFTEWLISLGVSRSVAEEDACRIEHVLSDESFEAIKKFVNNNK